MRYCALLAMAGLALAQESRQTTTYTYDPTGRRVADSVERALTSPKASSSGVEIPTINGGVSPLEKVDERVLSEGAGGRVVERIIRTYDPTGNPGTPRKVIIEERKNPDGGSRTTTTFFEGDVNGRFALQERTIADSRKTGDVTTTNTLVERPGISGQVQVVEKRVSSLKETEKLAHEDLVTMRRDDNGRFVEAARRITDRQKQDNKIFENSSEYIASDTGKLTLSGQTASRIETRPDGSETREVTIYGVAAPGRPASDKPQLREQQLIEKKPGAAGAVTESFSIRRPPLDDAGKLGDYQKISERVCTGCTKK